MITLQNLGDSILFTFDENDKYLNNGTISVPMNSLILVTDDSDMATFRKSATNDIFVSALYSDFGMTKAELEEWYAENMVSEVTEEDVDEKIAEAVGEETDRAVSAETALSGAIDAVDAAYKAADSVISGAVDNLSTALQNESQRAQNAESALSGAIDAVDAAYKAADSVISGAVDNLSTALQNESQRAVSAETALSGAIESIDSRLTEDEGVIGAGLNALNNSLSEKADISAVTEAIDAVDAAYKAADSVISGAVDNLSSALQNESQRAVSAETALSGAIDTKIDESAITSAITSASTDSEIPTAKAVYDALQESGLDEDTEKLISGSLNDLNERKLDASAFTAHTADTTIHVTAADKTAWNNKQNAGNYWNLDTDPVRLTEATSIINENIQTSAIKIYGYDFDGSNSNDLYEFKYINGNPIFRYKYGSEVEVESYGNLSLVETSAITTRIKYSSTDSQIPTAKAVNDKLGGLSLVKISQAAYDALENKDAITLYIIVDEPTPPSSDGKYKFTLIDDSVVTGECNDSRIDYYDISNYQTTAKEGVIGDCVTEIESYTFDSFSELASITIPSSITIIDDGTFNGCYSLTSIDIPSGVTSIGHEAFRGCSSLTSIEIPSGVTSIGGSAFDSCTGLTSVTVNATTPPTLGEYAFYGTNNFSIYVPSESVNAYKAASGWSDYASRISAIS